ncbi:hypothetical protein L227DRAFT_568735 [Lentinus tigrinus ALCF2SS1-6]|uniref:Uncharacterized protein n=1 Tax=Lentinus tigrinus ALCF2SS1-6 TaxID=1328759 RepID=A0A5C2RLL1_9APHY|nr:hypothetical protein L227DRAFT_568735 [Lentinus tigrinus ALCF2SS1-6]
MGDSGCGVPPQISVPASPCSRGDSSLSSGFRRNTNKGGGGGSATDFSLHPYLLQIACISDSPEFLGGLIQCIREVEREREGAQGGESDSDSEGERKEKHAEVRASVRESARGGYYHEAKHDRARGRGKTRGKARQSATGRERESARESESTSERVCARQSAREMGMSGLEEAAAVDDGVEETGIGRGYVVKCQASRWHSGGEYHG